MKIMASGLITSWQIDEGSGRETVTNFIFWGSKIIMDDDCSHEIKRHLLLERKAMTNLGNILKCRETTTMRSLCTAIREQSLSPTTESPHTAMKTHTVK